MSWVASLSLPFEDSSSGTTSPGLTLYHTVASGLRGYRVRTVFGEERALAGAGAQPGVTV